MGHWNVEQVADGRCPAAQRHCGLPAGALLYHNAGVIITGACWRLCVAAPWWRFVAVRRGGAGSSCRPQLEKKEARGLASLLQQMHALRDSYATSLCIDDLSPVQPLVQIYFSGAGS
jgi:hypothetical protein